MPQDDRKSIWLAAAGVVLGIVVLAVLLAGPRMRELQAERQCGQRHSFAVSNSPSFLPDGLALRRALEAASLQGFDTNRWRPETYSQTKAPDGTNDRFLCRNPMDDKQGLIKLTNEHGKYRYVQVWLATNKVECVVRTARWPSQ